MTKKEMEKKIEGLEESVRILQRQIVDIALRPQQAPFFPALQPQPPYTPPPTTNPYPLSQPFLTRNTCSK
jgi:hypothetical protein